MVEGDDRNGSYPNNPIIVNPASNPTFQRLSLKRSRSGNPDITYNYGVRACNATTCSEERRTAYMCLTSPGCPQSPMAATGIRCLHTDPLGSPVAETDEFGTVIKRTRYEPYGAPTDGVYVNGRGFTGHVTDAATGLTYMQQRYYDPLAGRFLSLDPVGVDNGTGGDFNRYWYANINLYKFTDPDGRCPVCPRGTAWRKLDDHLPTEYVMAIDIGISAKDRKSIANHLSKLLADNYSLYLKTHSFHWNVTGPMFNSLHLMFEGQYNELWLAHDVIAERIRALDVMAPGSYSQFGKLTSIKEESGVPEWKEMVAQLVEGHETAARTARETIKVADKADDQPTADLATQRVEAHEKTAWMLRSLLK